MGVLFSPLLTSRAPAPPVGLEGVRVVRSATARRVALRVDPARGQVCLVIPKRVSDKTAWAFAEANRAWIEKKLALLERPVPFADGMVIPIFGVDRTIRVVPGSGRTTQITLTDDALVVATNRADPASNIKRYLYQLMEETAWPIARAKAAMVEKTVQTLELRDTRGRWGSCSSDGRVMLSYRLVFAPMLVIDYVIAHECAHLKHMDHSQRFWDLCRDMSDNMLFGRHWLELNGDRILRYGVSLPAGADEPGEKA